MVSVGLRRNSVLKDSKKVGSFYFPPNLLQLKMGGNRIRIKHVKSNSLQVLLKHKGNFTYKRAAKIEGGILEYKDEKYRIAYKDVDGQIKPCVLMGDAGETVAFSNMDGTMEYSKAEDPVLEAVSILFLCIVRFEGTKLPDFSTYLGVLNKKFYGRFGKLSTVFPVIVIYVAVASIAFSHFYSTGIWALVALSGFVFVLIGSFLFLFLEYFRKKITIIETKRSSG